MPAKTVAGLRVTQGLVRGTVEGRSLKEVIETLGGGRAFPIVLPRNLWDLPVSRRLDGLPVAGALQRLLESFNYVMTTRADGRPASLKVLGPRAALTRETVVAAATAPPGTQAKRRAIAQPGDPGMAPLESGDTELETVTTVPTGAPVADPGHAPRIEPGVNPVAGEKVDPTFQAVRNFDRNFAPEPPPSVEEIRVN